MTLVEFLTARLDDAAHSAMQAKDNPARDAELYGHMPRVWASFHITFDPARVLREVESKRRILRNLAVHAERDEGPTAIISPESRALISHTRWHLRMLALPYKDHPEYNESWRP